LNLVSQKIQKQVETLNHITWALLGLSVLGGFAADRWKYLLARWEIEISSLFGFLFLLALGLALVNGSLYLAFKRELAPKTRREAFLALGFVVALLLLAVWAPSFLDALERSGGVSVPRRL
jgi:uncharacterized membrane protein YciS (DUF1049 family)